MFTDVDRNVQENTPTLGANKGKFYTYAHKKGTRPIIVFATVGKGETEGAAPRESIRNVFFNTGASDRNPTVGEQNQLDVLKKELEAFAVPSNIAWRWKEQSDGSMLERNWTDIVKSHLAMTQPQRHQQEAMWEFVQTELNYINNLIVIQDLVIAALINLHHCGFLLEVTPEKLFSNLSNILRAHQLFWKEVIYPMLCDVRSRGIPLDPLKLELVCLQWNERFSEYHQYCAEEERNVEFVHEQLESNQHFSTYIQWVETHPHSRRMRIGDMQARPHFRITKYPLLLKAVLKSTTDPLVERRLRGMLSSINIFLGSINDYLRLEGEKRALSIFSERLEGYEIEGINEEIDQHIRDKFDLTCPMAGVGPGVVRKLLIQQNLKVRFRKDSKMEVVALLFSDVLLMTKLQKKSELLKVVRPPLALNKIDCIALKDNCSFLLVEVGELCCLVNAYVFTTSTPESCYKWVSTINDAKVTLRNLREAESRRQSDRKRLFVANDEMSLDIGWKERLHEVQQEQQQSQSWNHTHLSIPTRQLTLVPGGYPDVDYPIDDLNTSYRTGPSDFEGDSQTVYYPTRKIPNLTQLEGLSPETKGFSTKPKSPIVYRKTIVVENQDYSSQTSGQLRSKSNKSFSGHDSDHSLNTKILTISDLKPTQDSFWTTNGSRGSLNSQSFSEPELVTLSSNKKEGVKTHRSVSDVTTGILVGSASPSSVNTLLERAMGRRRDRDVSKDRDTEWEKGEEGSRAQALMASGKWKEQLVDGEENDNLDRPSSSQFLTLSSVFDRFVGGLIWEAPLRHFLLPALFVVAVVFSASIASLVTDII
ncbi:pleckstrin homology domain-containing family G member 6 isoform X4 [Nerophis ophidion]|uniref:pleckstrin homology domain-containing family G member 6 isoform X4 n=1 Tax=Nerophis ophidion TaxID=159077 RepID=UPI002ADF42F7|nr:pleckstrin homology domain-containing family G member 6 isoform X4 [Nerophis ophidion]